MKLGTFNLRMWSLRGRKLASPLVIARRLAALPLLQIGKAVVFLACWLGWGLDDAASTWEQMP